MRKRAPKKRTHEPLAEGVLATIYKNFFGPLMQYKPDGLLLKDWLEAMFHTRTRDITQYVVKKPFKLPGVYVAAPYVKIQGVGQRNIRIHARIWARKDTETPDWVDVEVSEPNRTEWFVLTDSEWNWVRLHLFDPLDLTDKMEKKKWGLDWRSVQRLQK